MMMMMEMLNGDVFTIVTVVDDDADNAW